MKGCKRRGRRLGAAGFMLAVAVALAPVGRAVGADNRNACGCYKDDGGNCYCDKKAKCGCPGECEPKGCEEKRAKELEREIQTETKRAEESERRQGGESTPAPPPPEKKAPPARAPRQLTPKQRRELSELLRIYVSAHPDEGGKTVQGLLQDLGGSK